MNFFCFFLCELTGGQRLPRPNCGFCATPSRLPSAILLRHAVTSSLRSPPWGICERIWTETLERYWTAKTVVSEPYDVEPVIPRVCGWQRNRSNVAMTDPETVFPHFFNRAVLWPSDSVAGHSFRQAQYSERWWYAACSRSTSPTRTFRILKNWRHFTRRICRTQLCVSTELQVCVFFIVKKLSRKNYFNAFY